MYPVPLIPPDLAKLAAQGDVRRLQQGPRTVGEVLERARVAMDEQDRAEEMAADPVAWARAHRPRTLLNKLLGRI